MSRLSSTMLIANGHRPTPSSSPFCVADRPNSCPQSSITNARSTKQNDVATSAAKQVMNKALPCGAVSACELIVPPFCSSRQKSRLLPALSKGPWPLSTRKLVQIHPGRILAAGFHCGMHELHAAQTVFGRRHEQCAGQRRSLRIIRCDEIRDVAVHLGESFQVTLRMPGRNTRCARGERRRARTAACDHARLLAVRRV